MQKTMNANTKAEDILFDKIYACWMGKNIGGTLGEPVEGCKDKMNLTFFPHLNEGDPLPNDDLDLQLVNLHALEDRGLFINTRDLSEEWAEHVYFPYDEYGYALTNIRRGLVPPLSGHYNNPFIDCMGAPIRSELWAAVAAGRPDIAVSFARHDGMVDHAGGEGIHGEVFYAALESMAYTIEPADSGQYDLANLVEKSLMYIPEICRTYQAVKETLKWFLDGVAYEDIRGRILSGHGNDNFTDAPQNIAFTIVGLLYGTDFVDGLLKAVNLGYDTDCTAATLGAIYGILYGTAYIPKKWSDPIGTTIVVSPPVNGFNYPKDINELTRRTMKMAQRLSCEEEALFRFAIATDFQKQLFYMPSVRSNTYHIEIAIQGKDGPFIISGREKQLEIILKNCTESDWRFVMELRGEKDEVFLCEEEPMLLLAGGRICMEATVTGGAGARQVNLFKLIIRRFKDDSIWTEYSISFVLPRASRWLIDGKERYFGDGSIRFTGEGNHTAESELSMPRAQKVKLICASDDAVSLALNDAVVLDSPDRQEFMPAYHRGSEGQNTYIEIPAGTHKLRINICCAGNEGRATVALVAPEEIREPGAYYYFIDSVVG